MDVVYHTHYFVWFELGRTELMRELGCPYAALEDEQGVFFPLREVQARYRAPARYDQVLDVHTTLSSVGAAKVRFDYRVCRQDDGKLLVTGFTEHAAVDGRGRPVRLPEDLRERLLAGAPPA